MKIQQCADGQHHIRIGRRSPVSQPTKPPAKRGPQMVPVRREEVDRKGYVRRSR